MPGRKSALFRSLIVQTSKSSVHCEFDGIRMTSVGRCVPDPLNTRKITSKGFIQGTAHVLRLREGCGEAHEERTDAERQDNGENLLGPLKK